MKPPRHAKATQCPHCEQKWSLDLVLVQAPDGQVGEVGRCRNCEWSPYLGGFLRKVGGGYRFERPARSLRRRAAS